MASGTITGSKSYYCWASVKWSSTKGTGGSTVSATVYYNTSGSYYFSSGKATTVTINGETFSGTLPAVNGGSSATGKSASKWVAYTGNKSITISGSVDLSSVTNVDTGNKVGKLTCSGTAALDKVGSVPSNPTCSAPTTQYFTELGGTVTIKWSASTSYNSSGGYLVRVSINGGTWSDYKTITSLSTTSTTYSIPAGQGGTYQFAVRAYNDVGNSSWSYSGTVTRNSLSAPTIGTLSTFNPYVNATYNVPLSGGSQANGDGFTRRCNIHVDGTYKYAGTAPSSNDNKSVDITVTASNIAADLGTSAYSSSTKFTIVAWTQNSNGSRSSYVSKEFTVNLNSDGGATPTLNSPTFSGGILSNPSTCFVAGINGITITSGSGALRRAPSGTTLSYTIHVSGMYSVGGNTATYDSLSAGTYTATVTARDSRGLSTSVTKQFVVQSYAAPSIKSLTGTRLDDPNTSANVTYTLSYSPIYQYTDVSTKGNQLNSISVQQMNINGGDYSNYTSGTTITGLDTELAYKIGIRIADNVKTTTYTTAYLTIPTISSALSLRKWGVGIQCIPQNGYALDINGLVRTNSSITSSLNTSSYVNGSSGRAIINSTNTAGGYTTFLKGNSTNGAFTLSTYKDVVRIGYQSNDSISAGANSLTKYIDILAEDGTTSLNDLKVTGEIHVGSTFGAGEGTIKGTEIGNDGHIELSGSTPYIDFHYNNSSSDYTTRIQATGTGTLQITGNLWAGNMYCSSSEWLGFYNGDTRYTWMGRNGSSNTKFYFNAEDNVTQFYFNKDIYAPNLADSGWKTATLNSNFTTYDSGGTVRYRKIGKMVVVRGVVKPTTTLTFTGTSETYTIFTLPSGYRPPNNIYITCEGTSGGYWCCSLRTDGTVKMERNRAYSAGWRNAETSHWFPFHASFFVD